MHRDKSCCCNRFTGYADLQEDPRGDESNLRQKGMFDAEVHLCLVTCTKPVHNKNPSYPASNAALAHVCYTHVNIYIV